MSQSAPYRDHQQQYDKRKEDELADSSDKLATAIKYFDKGKLTFKYTNDRGQKRVVTERGAKDVTTEVL